MRYPTVEEVAEINTSLLGGGLRDPGLLASAVGRPTQTAFGEDAYPTFWLKVAALFESLACNHAFVDGNKRTAVIAAIHMLNWNGFDLQTDQCDVVWLAVSCAEHEIDLPKIADFFEEHAVPLGYPELDEDELGTGGGRGHADECNEDRGPHRGRGRRGAHRAKGDWQGHRSGGSGRADSRRPARHAGRASRQGHGGRRSPVVTKSAGSESPDPRKDVRL